MLRWLSQAEVGRVFTELVAGGHYEVATEARPYVTRLVNGDVDTRDPEVRRARLDAVFSAAMLDLHGGRPVDAASGFAACARLADAVGDEHAQSLAATARAHEQIALDRLAPAPVGTVGDGHR